MRREKLSKTVGRVEFGQRIIHRKSHCGDCGASARQWWARPIWAVRRPGPALRPARRLCRAPLRTGLTRAAHDTYYGRDYAYGVSCVEGRQHSVT